MGVALVTQHIMNGKEDKGDAVLATEGGILTSNKTECFSYLPVNNYYSVYEVYCDYL